MALSYEFPGSGVVKERAELAFKLPMGAASPLWAMYGAAAGVGVAYWWMSRWMRLANVEAFADFAAKPQARPIPKLKLVEAVAESAPVAAKVFEDVAETVQEAALAPVKIAEPAVEAAIDDLTRMTGIGPKLSAALAERGVTSFAQIAAWSANDLADIDAALALKGRAVREAWVAQAKRLAASA